MECASKVAQKPHAVCIPFPAQGHIIPMLKVAKLLHHKGFHITFVHTEFNYRRLISSRGDLNPLTTPSTFQFKTIPDGHHNSDATQDISAILSMGNNGLVPFRNLISNLNNNNNNNDDEPPPVTCIVSDICLTFTYDAAKEFGIPTVLVSPINACTLDAWIHFRALVERGLIPLKDESYITNEYLETPIDWIPGLKNVRLRDLPAQIRTTNPNDILLINSAMEPMDRIREASAIIINTFDALENETLDALKPLLPPLYTVGPLHLLHAQSSENVLETIGSSLWKEDTVCLEWLDSKDPNSVVYVNFGSTTTMTTHQLTEFAWGISNSNYFFLWIIRPDLVVGDSATTLPPDFLTQTKQRGLIVAWCPQEQVLNHPSIAGFLSHSGWNSVLESMCSGVPMLCWPFFADHPTICRYSCVHWEIAMEIDNDVNRDQVEKLIRELVEGDQGKAMKLKAMEWKKKAEQAVAAAPAGSSYINFNKLVDQVLKV